MLTFSQAKWLGGYKDKDGAEVRGFDTLNEAMATHFELIEAVGMPLLIRETVHLHHWLIADATVWRKK